MLITRINLICTHKNEDPAPPILAPHTPHERNPISQDATKRTSQTSSRKEQRNTELSLISTIPHAQIENDTREQTTFRDTKEETNGKEAGFASQDALECCDDTPYDGQSGQPELWRCALHDNLARYLAGGQ